MATLSELQTEVQSLLIDADTVVQNLTTTWINRAVRKLQVKHNFKVMESSATFTTTYLNRVLGSRPGDWKEPRGKPYYVEELGRVRPFGWTSSEATAQHRWGTSTDFDYGPPRLLFENDLPGELDIYPFPDGLSDYADGEYRIVVPYWKYLGRLIAPSDQNWFTVNGEQYIVYQAVAEGFYANEDEQRAQIWKTRADMEYKDVLLLDKKRRLSETESLVPYIGAAGPYTEE